MADDGPRLKRLADYAPPDFAVDGVELEFDLDSTRTVVRNRLKLRRAPGAAPLRLDGRDLELLGVSLDGAPPAQGQIETDAEGLTVHGLGDAAELIIDTAIRPGANRARAGLFEIGGRLASQCEPEGFRRISYFPDRPDVTTTWTVTLRADPARYPVLLSNGDRVAEGETADGRRWARFVDPWSKPSYLFAVVAGDFACLEDVHVTASGRRVDIRIWTDAELIDRCAFAMQALKRAFVWDEQTYGLEYDLDVFHVVGLSGWSGAMENKGLNLFGAAGIVADPEISTDDDHIIIERIVGHEYFHNWTGNRVTCRDWFQLCLKEGLTRFRDQHFIEDRLNSRAWRIEAVKTLRRNQFGEDDGPASHPIQPAVYAEIDNFYTNTVYDKGAEVSRMLRTLLGPALFREGVATYLKANDGRAAVVEDFVQAMEAVSGRDLTQFRLWYSQGGRPRLGLEEAWDADQGVYSLTLTQTTPPTPGQPDKAPFHIPVAVGLISPSGAPLSFRPEGATAAVDQAVLELTQARQTFRLDGLRERPIPSLPRGFSAPVSVPGDLPQASLAVLMAADPDPFARWDASQTLAVRLVRALADQRARGQALSPPTDFIGALEAVLKDDAADTLLKAFMLTLPDEPVLSEGLPRVDLDGLMAGRDFLRREIVRALRGPLLDLYGSLRETGDYAPDAAGVGRRRLRNAALDLLSAEGSDEIADLALTQLLEAGNMTDQFEALLILGNMDRPQRQTAADLFYDRWKAQPLVVEKWFNAQALSRAPGAVDRIIALQSHPAYDPTNFSQALVYYGGFFRQNRVAFHDPSGKGYAFLADRLLAMDAMGRSGGGYLMPQINAWRRYDDHRRALMQAALEKVAAAPGISNGLREIVSRALS